MDLTTLGLKKPLLTEAYNLQIINDNADKINELITADRQQINDLATKDNPTFTGVITTAGQIKFPISQSASSEPNTLDDYEEGTWTPVLKEGTNILTVATKIGRYTKIGNIVNIVCQISDITKSGTGNLTIEGLPFQSVESARTAFMFYRSTLPSGGYDRIAELDPVSTIISLKSNANGNVNHIPITANEIANPTTSDILINLTYII